MISVSCYLSLTIQVQTEQNCTGWTRPLLNLTPAISRYYTIKAHLQQAVEAAENLVAECIGNLSTMATVAGIGFSAIRFAAMGV